ncbi:MAG: Lrp/AsnC family transcriptional regulator [Microvirga sp.]|jgi:DNA-binding Lrp family transcriptional regulator|nr:Lrp/AsnC family transcriptional regulator [Microvirga sp.]MCD6071685.1 Lrp/AsnC family transcriptional regulator [Microvirga sp.]MDF2689836.1 Lrp/AsnC family transcriptional regulator [Microvirga sp.]MDF2969857.1 Lrp/AsnC family transcriptional regulator [Microvirga sp.]
MDEKNLQILRLLQQNARLPLKTLAGKVGLARSSVRERIARMEAEGIILGYKADVQPNHRGGEAVRALLMIRLRRTPARETVSRITALPAVRRCFSVFGDLDLVVEIEAAAMSGLNDSRDEIALMSDIADVTTAIVLKDEKLA